MTDAGNDVSVRAVRLIARGLFAMSAVAVLFVGCTLDRGGTLQQECTTDAECPVADANCEDPICEGGLCNTVPKPDGPLNQQSVGDCAVLTCDGGASVILPDEADRPANGPCATFHCEGAELVSSYHADGEICTLGNSTGTCDGAGTCEIICEFDSHCLPDPSKPCGEPYCDTSAGTCAYEPIQSGTSVNEVAGDCVLHLCAAGEQVTENVTLGDGCSVDSGNVCDGGGACVQCNDADDCATFADGGDCSNHQCVPPDCTDGILNNAETGVDCGGGSCPACANTLGCQVAQDCLSGFCNGSTCAPCGSAGDCAALGNHWCDAGVCKPQVVNGSSCTQNAQCVSGFCPTDDGICCNAACGAGCQSCQQAQTGQPDGTCAPVTAGTDPEGDCAPNASTCTGDVCTGTVNVCSPAGAATVCRMAAGSCDVAENCTGSSLGCPADEKVAAGVECRGDMGVCDVPEFCNGSSNNCPADAKEPSTVECRASQGVCDVAENCNGGNNCPADAKASTSTVCRAANGLCDVDETCTGSSNTCPSDGVAPNGTVCRAKNGACDVAETCNGSSKSCPSNGYEPNSVVCRTSADVCDEPESCPGNGPNCPSNGFKNDGDTPDAPGCGFYLCDGAMAGCPMSCSAGGDCVGGTICDSPMCCIDTGQNCQGNASNCCTGTCGANNKCE